MPKWPRLWEGGEPMGSQRRLWALPGEATMMSREERCPTCSLGEPEAAGGPARPLPWGSAEEADSRDVWVACSRREVRAAQTWLWLSHWGEKNPWERQRPKAGCSGRSSEQWGERPCQSWKAAGVGSAPPPPVTLVSESQRPFPEIEMWFSR